MDPQTVFSRKRGPYRRMDDCSIIHLGTRQIYLNEIGTRIWEAIDGERNVGQITAALGQFDGENAAFAADGAVTNFLADLYSKELLLAHGNNLPAVSGDPPPLRQAGTENCQYRPAPAENGPQARPKTTRDRIFQFYWDKQYIEKLHLELTYRCNLRCVHCYNSTHSSASIELSTQQWVDVLEQAAELGCYFLVFTGGEPFARKDILQIFEAACRLGYAFRINTNGSMIRQEHARALREMRPFLQGADISFYGATAAQHDKVTNLPGSYAKTRAVLDLLLQHEVPVVAKYVTMRMNFDGFTQFEDEMRAGEVPSAIHTGSMIPRTDRDPAPLAQLLTDEQYKKILAFRGDPTNGNTATNCIPGWNRGGITADGFVGPCEWLGDIRLGNVREASLRQIWYGPGFQALRESLLKTARECTDCELKSYCCSCPAHSYLETGSLFRCAPVQRHNAKICREFFAARV